MQAHCKFSYIENAKQLQATTETISERLLELKYDANEIVELLEVNQSTAHRWLSGESKPQRNSLKALAHARGVQFNWLAKGIGEKHAAQAHEPSRPYPFPDAETESSPTTVIAIEVHGDDGPIYGVTPDYRFVQLGPPIKMHLKTR